MASPSLPALRRALLYIPASSSKMMVKSLSLASDNLTYDLEDSVTPSMKVSSREALRGHLTSLPNKQHHAGEIAVRINAVSTPHAVDDLKAVASLPCVDTIVVPKVNSGSDLQLVEDVIREARARDQRPLNLLALIESAKAVMDLRSICTASPQLKGLIFAAEDFALDLSLERTPGLSEFLYARSAIVTAARAFGLESTIDLVCTAFRGSEGQQRLETECLNGRGLGFTGKQCIHPSQVSIAQRIFSPTEKEVEWSVRVVLADEKASAAGRGAWTLDGKMIDAPVVGKARVTLAKAERCGYDIDAIKKEWKDQNPE
ncbi:Pyruvate/Phosphoenolpyruvate kinase-like domain-containing protein [Achaetomium macrosporum]|uniref:Pyruvate/Phosphoenolpyruvate kinase-like domain-containing protein n=1 Tax=Achaetomium macrosporum TaxID=79813 RepID=A0AAN7C1G8_9PEZI|nr:Pyruvate/Phosphoenolpyruvate kinase-like domain-containing protein [Achaetomium macrosporum]